MTLKNLEIRFDSNRIESNYFKFDSIGFVRSLIRVVEILKNHSQKKITTTNLILIIGRVDIGQHYPTCSRCVVTQCS